MSDISAADVKKLRDATGAGMMDSKRALADAGGEFERARALLRERGLAAAEKRKTREATEGIIHAYLHAPNPGLPPRVGVMLELSCETDFVAKTGDFKELAQEIALHIAAARPIYVAVEEVPKSVLEGERDVIRGKLRGKPENIIEKATEGAVKSYLEQFVLLEQRWIKDDKQRIRDLIGAKVGTMGENIGVRRFVRYEVAESTD